MFRGDAPLTFSPMSLSRYLEDPVLHDFALVERPGARALLRRGYEGHAPLLGLDGAPRRWAALVGGGRAKHPLVELPGGERAVVRGYLRGGLMRHLNRERYLVGHRALDELRVTEHAARAGVRVPVVLAAVERRTGPAYTASLATRWIAGAAELAGWLEGKDGETVAAALRDAGGQLARMHDAGIVHPDVNLRNLLVTAEGVFVLDFDRARLLPHPVPRPWRARGLRRLARSASRLRAEIDAAGWAALREGYGPEWPLSRPLG